MAYLAAAAILVVFFATTDAVDLDVEVVVAVAYEERAKPIAEEEQEVLPVLEQAADMKFCYLSLPLDIVPFGVSKNHRLGRLQ